MKFDDSIWVISTVKGREKKRKEKVTYWGWGVVVGKIRKHQPGRRVGRPHSQSILRTAEGGVGGGGPGF